jgi:hypothetical protein
MRRTDPQVKYDKVRSSEEDEFQDHNRDANENYDDGYHDELGDDANSLLAPSSIMEPDDGFGVRGGSATPRYRRIHSRFSKGGSSCRPHGTNNCWLFGILATVAVTVSWVWSSGDGASNLLLQLRYATSQSKHSRNPDDELMTSPRPFLHELIADFHKNVTGNVSWLMDFAILGHSKCSTTSHMTWLRRHPEILMHDHEVHALTRGQTAEMVSLLYALPNRPNRKRGYKAPIDIMHPDVLTNLRTYWPETKIIIGVRHPVKWFESFYNFNKRQADRGRPGAVRLGPAETMGVPGHAHFHAHLSRLGKTNVTHPDEAALLGDVGRPEQPPAAMTNKVFLYESSQPYDLHNGRSARYRWDLETFLGLTEPLEPIPLRGETDGESYNYTSENFHYDIDICEDKFADLRRQLLEVGTTAAEWILKYFVPHPDVTVSSPDHFEELLLSWSIDPCESSRRST